MRHLPQRALRVVVSRVRSARCGAAATQGARCGHAVRNEVTRREWGSAIAAILGGSLGSRLALYGSDNRPASDEDDEEGRKYWTVPIREVATTSHTHIKVEGKVALVKREADGDIHIRLVDGAGHFCVAEIIPLIKLPAPRVGQTIVVRGIQRVDGKHKWGEVHPVESWR